jgi:hypothetical protein
MIRRLDDSHLESGRTFGRLRGIRRASRGQDYGNKTRNTVNAGLEGIRIVSAVSVTLPGYHLPIIAGVHREWKLLSARIRFKGNRHLEFGILSRSC